MLKKKSEVHLHIDGSLDKIKLFEIYKKSGGEYNLNEFYKMLSVDDKVNSLVEYLAKFETPLEYMQNDKMIYDLSKKCAENLEIDGYIYSELRFAPHLHQKDNMTLENVIETVLSAVKDGSRNNKINIILCIMRHLDIEKAMEIVRLADKYRDNGVCGIDIAGNEDFGVEIFESVLKKANKLGLNITIHAGESKGAESVVKAVEYGAKRIGHGIRSIEDNRLIDKLIEKDIMLEICPKSNKDTNVFKNFYKDYPIRKLYEKGIKIGLNCDNHTVSSTNLEMEAEILKTKFGFNEEEIIELVRNNIKYGFLDSRKKIEMLEEFDK